MFHLFHTGKFPSKTTWKLSLQTTIYSFADFTALSNSPKASISLPTNSLDEEAYSNTW